MFMAFLGSLDRVPKSQQLQDMAQNYERHPKIHLDSSAKVAITSESWDFLGVFPRRNWALMGLLLLRSGHLAHGSVLLCTFSISKVIRLFPDAQKSLRSDCSSKDKLIGAYRDRYAYL